MHVSSPCRVVDGVAAEEIPEGAEKVVTKEREARPVRQHEHSEMDGTKCLKGIVLSFCRF